MADDELWQKRVNNLRKLFRTNVPPKGQNQNQKLGSPDKLKSDSLDSHISVRNPNVCASLISSTTSATTTTTSTDKKSTLKSRVKHIPKKKANIPTIKGSQDAEITVFENSRHPAVVHEKKHKLKWKKGHEPDDEEISAENLDDLSVCDLENIEKRHDLQCACKIMLEVHKSGIMEHLLNSEQNSAIFQLFTGFDKHKPCRNTIYILHKAMKKLRRRVLEQNGIEIEIDTPLRNFLYSPKCTAQLFDILILVPEFVPECWGGKSSKVGKSKSSEALNKITSIVSSHTTNHAPALTTGTESKWSQLLKDTISQQRKLTSKKKRRSKKIRTLPAKSSGERHGDSKIIAKTHKEGEKESADAKELPVPRSDSSHSTRKVRVRTDHKKEAKPAPKAAPETPVEQHNLEETQHSDEDLVLPAPVDSVSGTGLTSQSNDDKKSSNS